MGRRVLAQTRREWNTQILFGGWMTLAAGTGEMDLSE
jgi:hypothetical protein